MVTEKTNENMPLGIYVVQSIRRHPDCTRYDCELQKKLGGMLRKKPRNFTWIAGMHFDSSWVLGEPQLGHWHMGHRVCLNQHRSFCLANLHCRFVSKSVVFWVNDLFEKKNQKTKMANIRLTQGGERKGTTSGNRRGQRGGERRGGERRRGGGRWCVCVVSHLERMRS